MPNKEYSNNNIRCVIDFLLNYDNLTKTDVMVLLYLVKRLNNIKFTWIMQSRICRKFNLDKASVSRSFINLIKLNIIERENSSSNKNYRFVK